MQTENQKHFPKVSDCCKASAAILCSATGQMRYKCTKCHELCDAMSDEGLEPKQPACLCLPQPCKKDHQKKINKAYGQIKCTACYDTGSFSVAEGGSIAMGDFVGDPSYNIPLKMVEKPCPKCKPTNKDNQPASDGKKCPYRNPDCPQDYPQPAQEEQGIQLQDYPVTICNACIHLQGNMCHTPGCAFIRCTMEEVKEFLNQTQICPLVNGEKIYTVDPIPQPSKKDLGGDELRSADGAMQWWADEPYHEMIGQFGEKFDQVWFDSRSEKTPHRILMKSYVSNLLHATDQKARRECAEIVESYFKSKETFSEHTFKAEEGVINKILNQK